MNNIDKINDLIENLYSDKKYSELKALSKLFSVDFLKDLEAILNKDRRNEKNFKDRIDVSVGWIDKIPLASFKNQVKDYNGNVIKNKVELGDFLLVHTHSQTFIQDGETINQNFDNRAIIIQAKLSNKRNPNVPIGKLNKSKVNSTSKELALLSDWPTFNLFKTSGSKTEILSDINLDKTKSNRKFSGYYKKHWDLGNPKHNQICDETMGGLITKMIDKKEGQVFKKNDTKDDWSRLINKIIELCGEYKLPGYIFGKQKNRYVFTGTLFSNPIILFFFFFKKKKFPVLTINRIFYEGTFE